MLGTEVKNQRELCWYREGRVDFVIPGWINGKGTKTVKCIISKVKKFLLICRKGALVIQLL